MIDSWYSFDFKLLKQHLDLKWTQDKNMWVGGTIKLKLNKMHPTKLSRYKAP